MDDPRDFLLNADGTYPELAGLPYWWDRIPPDARARDLPSYGERDVVRSSDSNWVFPKRWARSGPRTLLRTLPNETSRVPERCETGPTPLAAKSVPSRGVSAAGQRYRPEESEWNARIVHAIRALRIEGLTEETAAEEVAPTLNPLLEAVRSVVHKVKSDKPFGAGKNRTQSLTLDALSFMRHDLGINGRTP